MLNPWKNDAYSLIAMTAAINKIPNKYNRLDQLGIFRTWPITKTTFTAEEYMAALNMLNSVPRGAPAPKNTTGKRTMRTFSVPHYPLEDVILPDDAQGVRAFGTENADETLSNVMTRKLGEMRGKFDITREWLRMGALKGIIVDPNLTQLYSLYTEFGVAAKTIDFELDADGTNVLEKCAEASRHLEDNAQGETITGARCLCSPEFYDALTDHPKVQEAFKYFQTTQQLSGDFRRGFVFGNITFEEYRGNSTDPAGNSRKFIAANEGHIVPLGTSAFAEVFAPGTFNEAVNTLGLPLYAKQKERDFGMGYDVHAQMNVLPMCFRPELLIKVTI